MNVRTTTTKQEQEQEIRNKIEEIERTRKEFQNIQKGFEDLLEAKDSTKTEEIASRQAELAKRQLQNVRAQIGASQPKLRKDTTTHVGSPRLGLYTRKPKDPVLLQRTTKQDRNPSKAVKISSPLQVRKPAPGARTSLGNTRNIKTSVKSNGGSSSTISGRQASNFRVGTNAATNIQERLKKKSPWYNSILEPISGGGVKIPDPVGTDTGTYQHVETVTVPVNANGIAGLRIVCPHINSYGVDNIMNSPGSNYQTTIPASSALDLSWGGLNSTGVNTQGVMTPYAKVQAMLTSVAQSCRVVSGSVIAQPEISTLNDAGEMCAFVTPLSCNDSGTQYVTYLSQWDSAIVPINRHVPMCARWYPISGDFKPFNGNAVVPSEGVLPSFVSYQDFIEPDLVTNEGVIPFEYGVVCSGMTPSTGVVRFQIVTNFEFVPKQVSSMVSTTPPVNDQVESQLVNGWIAETPVTGIVSEHVATKPPSATTVPEEPSGFGMMFNVVEEMLPLMGKAAAMLL